MHVDDCDDWDDNDVYNVNDDDYDDDDQDDNYVDLNCEECVHIMVFKTCLVPTQLNSTYLKT